MSPKSPFKPKSLSVAVMIILNTCYSAEAAVKVVPPQHYTDTDLCWSKGEFFFAYVVLHSDKYKTWPHYISPWCDIGMASRAEPGGVIKYLNLMKFDSDDGLLRSRGLFGRRLESNNMSHLPQTKGFDPVYIFIGTVKTKTNSHNFLYSRITGVRYFGRSNLSLNDLLRLDANARFRRLKLLICRKGHPQYARLVCVDEPKSEG